jgi:hypothetical protein
MVRVPKALNTSEINKKGKEKNWLAGWSRRSINIGINFQSLFEVLSSSLSGRQQPYEWIQQTGY